MSELDLRDLDSEIERAITPANGAAEMTDTMQRLQNWAQSASAVNDVATTLVQSSFVPAAFRGKPVEATAAILAGMEVGLSPMASLKAFDVIQGVAAPRAITIRAIVQSHGHRMWIEEWDDDHCLMAGHRKGQPEQIERVMWDTKRATDMGLIGKDQWKKQKKNMLRLRCDTELGRILAADALLGIPYSAEEILDMDPVVGEVVVTTTAEKTAGKSLRDVAAERRDVPAPTPAPRAQPSQQPIRQDQAETIGAGLRDLGHTTKTAQLTFISNAVGRKITDAAGIGADDADKVIAALERATPAKAEPDVADPPADPEGW